MKSRALSVIAAAVAAALSLWFVSCRSSAETFTPRLEVFTAEGVSLADGSLDYDGEGGTTAVMVRSNGEWSVSGGASWLDVSPTQGSGDGSVTLTLESAADSRSAVIEVAMTAAPQVRVSFDVVQRVEKVPEPPQPEVIYRDSFDGAEACAEYGQTKDQWPSLSEFATFAACEGRGSEAVTYAGEGVSVRSDVRSTADDYTDASGCNNLMVGEYSMLQISGIALQESDKDLRLSFGRHLTSIGKSVVEDNDPYPTVWISGDGERWSRLEYDPVTVDGWHEVACDFSLAEVPEIVSFAFVCDQGFDVRLDDVALSTGKGGVTVDLAGGGKIERAEPPVEPPAERTVTVSEIVGMIPASTGRVVADEESDMLFHAVVQNDFAGGNNAAATLVVAEEGAVNAGCGISLCGSGVESVTADLVMGERVLVRLICGEAMLCNDGGAFYITGKGAEPWFEIESDGSIAEVAVATVDVQHLAEYQNMTVTVENVESDGEGVWCDDRDGEHFFSAAGDVLRIFVRGGAAAFADKHFGAARGRISGVVAMRGGEAWLCPRNAEDVKDFEIQEPLPPLAVTIPEIIAMISTDGGPTEIDASRDRILEAIVMNDVMNGNCNASQMVLATEGSAEPRNGITLYGSCVKPSVTGVRRGDRVAVTLKAGVSVVLNYEGMYEITGDESTRWAEIEILESGCTVPPVDITASELVGYQGMAVRIRNATPQRDGRWYDASLGGDILFTTADGDLTVRVLPAAVFADDMFDAVSGDIVGMAAVIGGRAVLMPRDGSDVAAYACMDGGGDNPDDNPDDMPGEDPVPDDPVTPSEPQDGYVMVTSLSDLGPGTYYIGGYQKGRLYLATGGLTSVNHCLTSEFTFDNGRLEALGAAPVAVKIESAGEENGYYVRFDGDGYLSATGSGAGKLRFTQSRAEYWIFSESVGGGFDMLLSGDKFVRLIVSKTAAEALLRSVAADEQGNAIVLIRVPDGN